MRHAGITYRLGRVRSDTRLDGLTGAVRPVLSARAMAQRRGPQAVQLVQRSIDRDVSDEMVGVRLLSVRIG